MKKYYAKLVMLVLMSCFSLLCCIPVYSGIVANGISGQTQTAYPGGGNVPIFVWCSNTNNSGSLTATASTAGSYTFKWYRFEASSTSWQPHSTSATSTSSTITGLSSGGYRVEVVNGSNAVIECYHVWVWNLGGTASITTSSPACNSVNAALNMNVSDTFKYYTPPPSPSYINANTQISVCFTATHTYVSDLAFYLIAPPSFGNTAILLSPNPPNPNAVCNPGQNVNNLCFSTGATNNFYVCGAATPLTGNYGSYGASSTPINWSALNGANAIQGGWRVQIFDCIGADVGSLTNATLTFSNLTSVCGSPSTITYTSGNINSPINDNSCNSASASRFEVPVSYTATQLSVNATRNINWSSSTTGVSFTNGNSVTTNVTVPQGSSNLSASITYSIGGSNCVVNTTSTYNNTIKPIVSVSPANRTICSGQQINTALTANLGGTTFAWTIVAATGVTGANAGSGNTISQTLSATGNTQGSVIYAITPTLNGCAGTIKYDTVKVNPNPVATAAPSPQTICSGTATSIALSSNVSGTTYTWTAPAMTGVSGGTAGSGAIIAQTLTATGTSQGTAIYTITPTANGCPGTAIKDTVKVNPLPVATASPSPQTICSGTATSIALSSNVSGTTYAWSAPVMSGVSGGTAGSGASIAQTLTATGTSQGTAIYTITPTTNGCVGAAIKDTVYVKPVPVVTNNPLAQSICTGATATINLQSNISGTSFNWTANATNVTGAANGSGNTISQALNTTTNAPGTVVYSITPSLNGCTGPATNYTVTVKPKSTGIQTTTICQGQSYSFNGITYTASNNTAKDTLLNQYGCDSIITLNLTVTPAITNTINPVICRGNSYNFGGTNYTNSQTGVVHTFQTAGGCDSIVTMNLTVTPAITHTISPVICQGNSYNFAGTNYTTSQTGVVHTFQTASGCDSIVTMNLTVNPAITHTINPVICRGNSYNFAGTNYTTSQTGIVHTFQTTQGCDSIVTMNLTVSLPLTHTINPVICQGNSYNFGGTVYTTSQTGIVHNFPTALGCDSLVTMNLTVSPPLTHTINPVICQSNSYTFAGTAYTTSQTGIVHTFQTAQGCDSIVTMNLTVNPITYGTQTTVLCQGQSFTFNGITYTSSNYIAKDTLVNQYGCDSIVTLNLTINPVTSGTQTVVICQGHSYTFNGITYNSSNTTAKDTLVNQYGCDSMVTLNLTVTPAPTTTLNDSICLGDSYTFGPHVFNTSQTGIVHNFPTAQGCDSMVTLNLTVLNIVPQPLLIKESGCDVVRFEGNDYTNTTILHDTLYSDFGCDSIYRRIEITVHKTVAYEQRIDTTGCDEVFVNGIRYTADAQLRDTLRNQYGCDSVYRNFHIKVYRFQLELSFTPDDPYQMERIEFKTASLYGNDYKVLSWLPVTAFSDQDARTQIASFTQPTQVVVRASSLEGCTDEFRVDINPREYSKDVAVPNAFSPNGDGLNDIFRPVLKLERAYNTMDFRVYNRYGQLVHATANMNHGWDGMYNGRPADKGVYSYKLVIYFLDGTNKTFSGEVTLVR